MKQHDFYRLYANTPTEKRREVLSNVPDSPLCGLTLNWVYWEIHKIDEKLLDDEIRRQQLLDAVKPFLK